MRFTGVNTESLGGRLAGCRCELKGGRKNERLGFCGGGGLVWHCWFGGVLIVQLEFRVW